MIHVPVDPPAPDPTTPDTTTPGTTRATAREQWHQRMETAAMERDGADLRRLLDEAHTLFGDQASARWAEALSAYDSTAQTG